MPPDTSFARDPRLLPIRDDIAARAFADAAPGRRLVDPLPQRVRVGATAIRSLPSPDAQQVNQALFGETFDVLDVQDGWAWGQLQTDGYVGWIVHTDLAAPAGPPTHRVRALRTFLFRQPDLKSPPLAALSLNALARVDAAGTGSAKRFVRETGGGWIFGEHLAPIGTWEPDFVAVAERFVGAPYLWGGRESAGIDCSGLVQSALMATGRSVLRDSDMQEATLGAPAADSSRRRGDLLFWPGHVGILLDEARLLHANAWHMATEIEPVAEAVARIGAAVGPVRSVRRLA
jgi:cell wall-associated NlpC family hydrolase